MDYEEIFEVLVECREDFRNRAEDPDYIKEVQDADRARAKALNAAIEIVRQHRDQAEGVCAGS